MAKKQKTFSNMSIGITLDGTKFNEAMKDINQNIKVAESQMKSNLKVLGDAEKSYDDMQRVLKDTQKVYDNQKTKLDALNRAHRQAVDLYGSNSKQAQRYKVQINNLTGAMATTDRQIKNTTREMIYLDEGVNEANKAMKESVKRNNEMTSALKNSGRKIEAAANEQKSYAEQMERTQDLMNKQQKVIQRLTNEFGENSQEVQKAKQSYGNLQDSLKVLEVQFDGATRKLQDFGYEGAEGQAQLQRELSRTKIEIQNVENSMKNLDQSSEAFKRAEAKLTGLKQSLQQNEAAANEAAREIRELGNQPIDTTELDNAGGKLDKVKEKANQLKAAFALAMGATGALILKELDEAIEKIGILSGGLSSYREGLKSGVKDSSYIRQAQIYGIEGNGNVSGGKRLENVGTLTGFDAPEIGKSINLLVKRFGFTTSEAESRIIQASREGITELDEVVEYLGAQQIDPSMSKKDKVAIANFMLTGAAKAVQSGGARNTDNAFDFYNEATVRAFDPSKTQRDKFAEAGGDAALKAQDQFLEDGNIINLMKSMDKAIKDKFETPTEQRKAWIDVFGTQAEMIDLPGIEALVNGDKPLKVVDENGNERVVTGELTKEEQDLLTTKNNVDKLTGSLKELGVTVGVALLPTINKLVQQMAEFFKKNGKTIVETIEGFITGFTAIVAPFISNMLAILSKLLSINIPGLGNIAGVIGKLAGVLAVLALINIPTKLIGNLMQLLGKNGPISTFLSQGVAGKAGTVAKGAAKGAANAGGGVVGKVANVGKGALGMVGRIAGILGPVGMIISGITIALPLIISLVKKLYNECEPFRNFIDNLWAKIQLFWEWLKPILGQIWAQIKTVMTNIKNVILVSIKFIYQNIIKPYLMFIFTLWSTIFKSLFVIVSTIFKKTYEFIKIAWGWIKNTFVAAKTNITNVIKSLTSGFKTMFINAFNFVKEKVIGFKTAFVNTFVAAKTNVTNVIKSLTNGFKMTFVNAFNFVKEKVVGFKTNLISRFNEIKNGIGLKVSQIVDNVKSLPSKIMSGLKNGAKGLKNAASVLMNGMIGGVENGLNKVVSGVNNALDKFGVDKKIKTLTLPKLKTYAKGTKHHPGGLAIINDQKGSNYREYVQLPNGEGFVPQGRNVLLDLPKGSKVLNAEETKKNRGIGHIPYYKNGVGEIFKTGLNWTKEKIKNVTDVSKRVLKYVEEKIGFNETTLTNAIVKGMGKKLIENASNFIFKNKNKIDASQGEANGFTGNTKSVGGARINGVYADLYNLVKNVISKYPSAVITSGLRVGARTKAGTLSDHALGKGLDISGYGSNGSTTYTKIANDLFESAITKYVITNDNWKWKNKFNWKRYPYGGHMNHVHVSAFRRGGFVNNPTLSMIGEAGPETVIPLSNGLRTRGLSLLNQTARLMGYNVTKENNADLSALEHLLQAQQKQIDLLTQLVNKNSNIYMDGQKVSNKIDEYKRKNTTKTNIARGI